jgi:phosphoribosylpyrophosphate synthetase
VSIWNAPVRCCVKRFSDGEIQIEINENVRTKDVFVLQSTCDPVNDNLVELLLWWMRSKERRPGE